MPKIGNARVQQRLHLAHNVIQRRGIAGAVREKNSRRFVFERVLRRSGCRQNLRGKSVLPQSAKNVVFHSVIKRDNGNVRRRQRFVKISRVGNFISANQIKRRALLVFFVPAKCLFVRDFLDVIHTDEDKFLRAFDGFGVGNFFRGNKSVHRAAHAQFFC